MKAKKLGQSYRQSDYSDIPDTPTGRANIFAQAVRQALASTADSEKIYSRLPETIRKEFSFPTFQRNVAAQRLLQ